MKREESEWERMRPLERIGIVLMYLWFASPLIMLVGLAFPPLFMFGLCCLVLPPAMFSMMGDS